MAVVGGSLVMWDTFLHPVVLGRSLSTEYRRQSTEGYPAMVDLSVGVCVIRNRMVTQGTDSDLDRFGPSDRRNTLRPVSLVYCIDLDD